MSVGSSGQTRRAAPPDHVELDDFIAAAKRFDWDRVFVVLRSHPEYVNMRPEGRTFAAIHQAAYHGNVPTLRRLIEEFGADPELKNKGGQTAASVAAEEGNTEANMYLNSLATRALAARTPVDVKNLAGETVWGPADVENTEPLSVTLLPQLALAMSQPEIALRLKYDMRVVKPEESLAVAGVPAGASLLCVVVDYRTAAEEIFESIAAHHDGKFVDQMDARAEAYWSAVLADGASDEIPSGRYHQRSNSRPSADLPADLQAFLEVMLQRKQVLLDERPGTKITFDMGYVSELPQRQMGKKVSSDEDEKFGLYPPPLISPRGKSPQGKGTPELQIFPLSWCTLPAESRLSDPELIAYFVDLGGDLTDGNDGLGAVWRYWGCPSRTLNVEKWKQKKERCRRIASSVSEFFGRWAQSGLGVGAFV